MHVGAEKRRYPRRKPFATQLPLDARVIIDGNALNLKARLIDIGRGGMRVELPQALEDGSTVQMSGELEDLRGKQKLDQRCYVQSCTPSENGKFIIRLAYELKKAAAVSTLSTDLYEILQLSRSADFDTVQRVFRILAQR